MRSLLFHSLIAIGLTLSLGGAALAGPITTPSGRVGSTDPISVQMRFHQGRWWYQHPDATWSYYQGGQWVKYHPALSAATGAAAVNGGGPQRVTAGYRGVAPGAANSAGTFPQPARARNRRPRARRGKAARGTAAQDMEAAFRRASHRAAPTDSPTILSSADSETDRPRPRQAPRIKPRGSCGDRSRISSPPPNRRPHIRPALHRA